MQKTQTTRRQADRGTERRKVSRPRRTTHCAHSNPATDVLTLAPASVLSLPSLAGVPLSFTYREETDILVPVAEYLIKQGHATEFDWHGDLANFTQAGIDSIIRSTRIHEFTQDAPPLTATLADHEGYYSRGYELEKKKLLLGIGSSECGWMRMGPVTRKLERTAPGLGAAFYAAVIDSLEEVGWVFDYSRAEFARDQQREMIAEENDKDWDDLTAAERDQYEVRDPDKDIPKYLIDVKRGGITAERRELLKQHRARHPKLIGLALEMCEHAAKLHNCGPREWPEGDSPCTYLVFFQDHDAITAAFDDWSEHFLEGDVTYVWTRTFRPAKPAETRKAFEAFDATVRLMSTAAQLAPLVNGVKK